MNLVNERRAIDEALSSYRNLLEDINEDRFTETPSKGGWSYAEVYDHILKATLASSIALERCTHNVCAPTKSGPTLIGHYVLLSGTFPPFKLKAPPEMEATVKKISREEAKNLIIKARKRLDGIVAPIKTAKPKWRNKHPRMGMLNAWQWLKFIRIHLQHHLKQLERIKADFNRP
ncbi:DinB family protein [Mucilaginibacter achroorhodeus]|uniref:DinB family protein n=1 Tax=Mucilaginibacter achroorhodeus TaxID=2599294 RepID=A0A563U9Z8_9SPHI|nr:DinB family protein [Mucilaginibacter achroorhodeus]TWR28207.1 DinB family protein [Mucilaginibacter achroorhodeus]